MSDDEFSYLKDSLDAHSRRRIEGKAWNSWRGRFPFRQVLTTTKFEELKLKIEGIEKQLGQPTVPILMFPRSGGFQTNSKT